MKLTVPLLFLPFVLAAQVQTPVNPVISKDYLEQVRKLRGNIDPVDSVANARNTIYKLKGQFNASAPVKGLKISNDFIQISPSLSRYIKLSGSYSGTIELKTHNRLPRLQDTYSQGRSANGSLQWQGAETGELFSYGPAVNTLEFDGSGYPYDKYGKLVTAGNGNGKPANVYQDDIFRTSLLHSHQLNIHSSLHRYGKRTWYLNLKLTHLDDQQIIRENKSSSNGLSTDLSTSIKWLTLKAIYMFNQEGRTTSDRNGMLNRAYQNALLTPVTFDNQQGTSLGEGQRSYSASADNPWFLLRDNVNPFRQQDHTGGLTLKLDKAAWQAEIIQSINYKQEHYTERYRPGTVGWNTGMYTDRNRRDLNYLIQSKVSRDVQYGHSDLRSTVQLYHTYSNASTSITYQPDNNNYDYQRSSHDLFLNIANTYSRRGLDINFYAGNKAYISNTSNKNNLFLPALHVKVILNNLPGNMFLYGWSSYHIVNSELQLDKSLAYTNLLQYNAGQVSGYRPVVEVSGYRKLSPIQSKEWSNGFNFQFRKLYLTTNFYIKNTRNNVFPINENGQLTLKNLADMRTKGMEASLNLDSRRYHRQIGTSAALSIFTYRTDVTRVRDGYNFTPVAGFRNVHKALVEGQPLGVIVGNSYRRDPAGNIIIGDDGFPLTDEQPKVIGNTIPDFVLKATNNLFWQKLSLQTNLEWKKGGQAWNGTQAALDYYGRSATTGTERNTTGYIFKGVKQDGHVNDIPVAFYDPTRPVTANRWSRYGLTGIAEEYIQKTDYLRINSVTINYKINLRKSRQLISLSAYVENILLWSPYKGADPEQLLYDQPNTTGLDYFNLPGVKTYGFNVTYQF